MRLMSGGSSLLGDGVTKGYMEVVEGLGVKSWAVSHGLCSKPFPYQTLNNPTKDTDLGRSQSRALDHIPAPLIANAIDSVNKSLGMNLTAPAPDRFRVYTSSAFFIHDVASSHEILIWGDVEPDSLSASPRNAQVWQDAAPKVAAGNLKGIFIECSYDDSRSPEMLFGHLTPRYLMEELKVLAAEVEKFRGDSSPRRRTRDRYITQGRVSSLEASSRLEYLRKSIAKREKDRIQGMRPSLATAPNFFYSHRRGSLVGPLEGVKVVIIHVKDTLDDKEDVKEVILRELGNHEEELNLGCEFVVSERGMSVCL
ncbi:0efc0157-9030-4555-b361-85707b0fe206 [Sclerotinia trifoliorum]|uniref:0efc0157-9030-4555-b361-85707b0fe206 n=1 Tax=Sclerotinia trifoliorum TaxID=28548 RepID=A0A8H2VQR8_9HELO|nr:0efc0157-9030-4555-b361-85707b0fe206 [Sclerotinia trifoliorum]